jgi:hypothetical protein
MSAGEGFGYRAIAVEALVSMRFAPTMPEATPLELPVEVLVSMLYAPSVGAVKEVQ